MEWVSRLTLFCAGSSKVVFVFHLFSGTSKNPFYQVLYILNDPTRPKFQEQNDPYAKFHPLRPLIGGVVFDSCPVDFVSNFGLQFFQDWLGAKSEWLPVKWGLLSFRTALDLFFLDLFEEDRANYWRLLEQCAFKVPHLVIYCQKGDPLIDVPRIDSFITKLKTQSNVPVVLTLCPEQSKHIKHFKLHPKEYRQSMEEFLTGVRAQATGVPVMRSKL
jgi:hypothetical protein